MVLAIFYMYQTSAKCAGMCLCNRTHQMDKTDFVVSVSIIFPSNSKRDAQFHCIAYHYSCADWDILPDHLRDVPWEDIFQLGASAAASEFCKLVQVGIDVYIHHCKYEVKSYSSPWFSAVWTAATVHRSCFLHLSHQNKTSQTEVKFC